LQAFSAPDKNSERSFDCFWEEVVLFDDIAGKIALVTGASSGLGLHFAEMLAKHKTHVVLAARNEEAMEIPRRGRRNNQ
jgi:NADPH:quinone reductase-like Zn-dependent oxidoreductase